MSAGSDNERPPTPPFGNAPPIAESGGPYVSPTDDPVELSAGGAVDEASDCGGVAAGEDWYPPDEPEPQGAAGGLRPGAGAVLVATLTVFGLALSADGPPPPGSVPPSRPPKISFEGVPQSSEGIPRIDAARPRYSRPSEFKRGIELPPDRPDRTPPAAPDAFQAAIVVSDGKIMTITALNAPVQEELTFAIRDTNSGARPTLVVRAADPRWEIDEQGHHYFPEFEIETELRAQGQSVPDGAHWELPADATAGWNCWCGLINAANRMDEEDGDLGTGTYETTQNYAKVRPAGMPDDEEIVIQAKASVVGAGVSIHLRPVDLPPGRSGFTIPFTVSQSGTVAGDLEIWPKRYRLDGGGDTPTTDTPGDPDAPPTETPPERTTTPTATPERGDPFGMSTVAVPRGNPPPEIPVTTDCDKPLVYIPGHGVEETPDAPPGWPLTPTTGRPDDPANPTTETPGDRDTPTTDTPGDPETPTTTPPGRTTTPPPAKPERGDPFGLSTVATPRRNSPPEILVATDCDKPLVYIPGHGVEETPDAPPGWPVTPTTGRPNDPVTPTTGTPDDPNSPTTDTPGDPDAPPTETPPERTTTPTATPEGGDPFGLSTVATPRRNPPPEIPVTTDCDKPLVYIPGHGVEETPGVPPAWPVTPTTETPGDGDTPATSTPGDPEAPTETPPGRTTTPPPSVPDPREDRTSDLRPLRSDHPAQKLLNTDPFRYTPRDWTVPITGPCP